MRQHLARLTPVLFVGGCSLLYNPSNISKQPIDAAIDAPPIDANPANLSLSGAAPATIDEGQGDFGSRPAILVLHGSNFVSGAQVAITATETIHVDVDNTHVALSAAADYLAVPVTAHVDPAIPEKTIALTITVTQQANGSPVTQMLAGKLSLQGHAELDASHLPPTDGTALAGKYSKIDLPTTTAFKFTGGTGHPVLLRSVSSIAIGAITAIGNDASGSTGGGAGPGGCDGGNGVNKGGCDGGGLPGTPNTITGGGGGGGAGFAAMGTGGMGSPAGAGGPMVGDDMIATYAGFSIYKADVAAGGGGGGGTGLLSGPGGGGGGGGGTVELTAGGDLTAGAIDTTGGAGGAANSSGGGGGAGGVIMVRAGGTLATGMLKAPGGAGGSSGGNSGGAGSDGRIRWDAPGGNAPSATPTPVRGPAFVATSAVLTTTPSLQLVGTPNHTFTVYWIDDAGQAHTGSDGSFGPNGMATIAPSLARGYSRVCITLMGGQQGTPEADKCIDVAYLP